MKKLIVVLLMLCAVNVSAAGFDYSAQSNGRDTHASRVLAQSAVPVSVGGTTAEVTLATVQLPPMKANDGLYVYYIMSYGSNTNTKAIRAKLGSTTLYTANRTVSGEIMDSTHFFVHNRGATNSQVFATAISTHQASSQVPVSVETGNGTTFTITGQTTLETGFTPATANISGSAGVVTVNYTSHGLNTGEWVQAAGSSTSGYNVDPVQVTRVTANQFTYPSSGTGTPATSPTIKRYSPLQLESYTVQLLPAAN